jgi:hypothetical protein
MITVKHKRRGRPSRKNKKSLIYLKAFLELNGSELEKCAVDMYRHAIVYGSVDEYWFKHYMEMHGLIKPISTVKKRGGIE